MDDDLQNPPEEVIRLWHHTRDNQYDVVYTRYANKQHQSWRNLGSRFTNWCADFLLDKPRGLYLSSFRCINRFVADAILEHPGPYPYIDGLILQCTQTIGSLEVQHLERQSGDSNYTLRRLMNLFMSMFLNFSVIPLRVATVAGIIIASVGLIGILIVVIEALLGSPTQGWASLMAALLFLTGSQLLMLGLLGEYLGRLFLTANKKPQYLVRQVSRNH
jgi:undecaprenyl-phosphate 4-deoxy-4-formamido-L-arabinose transferase